MTIQIIKRLLLIFSLAISAGEISAQKSSPSNNEFIVPIMKKFPVIDGVFNKSEWDEAVGFYGMTWKDKLEDRSVQTYVGATEDAIYVAIISELPEKGNILCKINRNAAKVVQDDAAEIFISLNPESTQNTILQYLFNSKGFNLYKAHVKGGGKEPPAWQGKYELKNSFSNGKWISEVKIPLKAIAPGRKITDGTWGISICRDWKQPWIFSSAPGNFFGTDTKFQFVKNAPAIQFKHQGDFMDKEVKAELSIKNTGTTTIKLDTLIVTDLDQMPSVRLTKKINIEPGKTVVIPYDASQNATNCSKFKFMVKVSGGGKTYYYRSFKWDKKRPERWTTEEKKVLSFDFEFAYYPYRNLLRVHNLFQNYKKKLPQTVSYKVTEKKSGKLIKSVSCSSGDGHQTRIDLPELDGTYVLTLQLGKEKLSKEFIRRHYKWEKNKLGMTRKVYPPFTDMKVNGNMVSTVLKDHKLGANGLPLQISVKDVDILAAPINLRVNGTIVNATEMRFTEKSADVVKTESKFSTNDFSADAKGRWEYDGCLKYDLTLNHRQKIQSMVLEIPLKDKYATMYHAMGDGIRNTLYDYFKTGQGEIWSSTAVKSENIPENFCTYIFLGSPLRGLSFFAENDKGWSWNRSTPNMRVVRKGGTLTLIINLINEPLTIKSSRTLSFGLLAAPVKPRIKNWRTLWTLKKFSILGTCINWMGGPGECSNVYPFGRDEYFWKMLAKGNVGRVSRKELDECFERAHECYKPFKNIYESRKDLLRRHVDGNIGGGRLGHNMVFYYNRAVYSALEEYKTFMNEWLLPDFPSRSVPETLQEIKIVPSRSYDDFALYWYNRSFAYRNRGVYWDNWFLWGSYNTEMTDAYYNADGSITPAAGIWGLRKLAKRTFQLMNEKGMTPITMAHMTSTSILPMLSFATVQYDWEWKYSEGDVQYRFTRPYNMLVSNGELAGAIPVLLPDKGKQSTDQWIQRTQAGVAITHELIGEGQGKIWKSLYKPLLKQYSIKPNVKVLRYWDSQKIVISSNPDYAWILYYTPGKKALLVICSYSNKNGNAEFQLDMPELGLKPNALCTNFETGEPLAQENGKLNIRIKKHEVIAIELANKKRRKQ